MLDIKTVKLRTEEEIIASWNNKEKVVVSVICATYNHELYIEDAIIGFLMQETDFAFEIIIHDDASTDNTAEIIRNYQSKYPNIIKPIYQKENQYSKGNFRPTPYAGSFAKGEYITLCEGDDYWVISDKLQLQYNFLHDNREYIVCGTNCAVINEHNDVIRKDRWEHKGYKVLMTLTVMYRNIIFSSDFSDHFKKVSNGDTGLFLYLESKGKVFLSEKISACYRVSTSGIWSTKNVDQRLLMSMKTWEVLCDWAEGANSISFKYAYRQLVNTYAKLLLINLHKFKIKEVGEFSLLLIRMIKYKKASKYPNIVFVFYLFFKILLSSKNIYKQNY